jgi:hypothetical protein
MPLPLPRRKFLIYLGLGTLCGQAASWVSRSSAAPIITPESIARSQNQLPEFHQQLFATIVALYGNKDTKIASCKLFPSYSTKD